MQRIAPSQAEEAFVLKQKHKHFQRKRKREQGKQIQVAERTFYGLGTGAYCGACLYQEEQLPDFHGNYLTSLL